MLEIKRRILEYLNCQKNQHRWVDKNKNGKFWHECTICEKQIPFTFQELVESIIKEIEFESTKEKESQWTF